MKNAIQKAIEWGYTNYEYALYDPKESRNPSEIYSERNEIILDPLFWQCLGKALGWEKYGTNNTIWQSVETWKYQWHSFIDHIADGGDVDEFFNNLIK